MHYYKHKDSSLKPSRFFQLSADERNELLQSLNNLNLLSVEIIAYCIMPTHFHIVVKQLLDSGIETFMSRISNSYSHYYNTKHTRHGSLFSSRYRSVMIITDEQLVHTVRYVHLNPITSYVVKDFDELLEYKYSSLPEYLNLSKSNDCTKKEVLDHFKNIANYKKHLFDQVDYQRSLENIKHIVG